MSIWHSIGESLRALVGRRRPQTAAEHPMLAEWQRQQEYFRQLHEQYPGLAWYCEIRLRVLRFLVSRYGHQRRGRAHRLPVPTAVRRVALAYGGSVLRTGGQPRRRRRRRPRSAAFFRPILERIHRCNQEQSP